jgi:hypothetical protein
MLRAESPSLDPSRKSKTQEPRLAKHYSHNDTHIEHRPSEHSCIPIALINYLPLDRSPTLPSPQSKLRIIRHFSPFSRPRITPVFSSPFSPRVEIPNHSTPHPPPVRFTLLVTRFVITLPQTRSELCLLVSLRPTSSALTPFRPQFILQQPSQMSSFQRLCTNESAF